LPLAEALAGLPAMWRCGGDGEAGRLRALSLYNEAKVLDRTVALLGCKAPRDRLHGIGCGKIVRWYCIGLDPDLRTSVAGGCC